MGDNTVLRALKQATLWQILSQCNKKRRGPKTAPKPPKEDGGDYQGNHDSVIITND